MSQRIGWYTLVLVCVGTLILPSVTAARPLTQAAHQPVAVSEPPQITYGQTPQPQLIDPSAVPTVRSADHGGVRLAFHPRDLPQFQHAKQRAQSGIPEERPSLQVTTFNQPSPITQNVQGQAEQVLANFPVMTYEQQVAAFGSDQEVWPPDTQMAAGPTYLIEMVNNTRTVWSKSGAIVALSDLKAFFGLPAGYHFSDPRVLYDSISGRFFASGLSFDAFYDSQVYVAVSTSSDPTGSWYIYTVESNTSGILYDQPKIGVNSDKVVVSWNDYGNSGATFTGQETWILQKSNMLVGGYAQLAGYGPDLLRFDVVPSQSLTATSTEYLVYNNADPYTLENQGYPTLGVVAITGTPAQGNVAWTESDPSMAPTSMPPGALQPGGGPLIDTGDDRLLSATWQNGVLWTGGNDGCVPLGDSFLRSCLRLIQVSTSGASPTILQNFDVASLGSYLFYPAVTLDAAGDAFVALSISSASLDATAATTVQPIGAAANSIGNLLTFRQGIGIYDDCGSNCMSSPNNNRWGDYSAAAPDPMNSSAVWVTGEYAASSADAYDWGTGVAEVMMQSVPSPTLTVTQTPTATATSTPTATATATPSPSPTPVRVYLPLVAEDSQLSGW
jgi:hypothetical protein